MTKNLTEYIPDERFKLTLQRNLGKNKGCFCES